MLDFTLFGTVVNPPVKDNNLTNSINQQHFLCTGGAYYVPYSFLFISNKFCNWGGAARAGWLSSFIHLLLHPTPVWPRNLPYKIFVHKTTYAPMIYTALCLMFWMHAYPLLRQVGGGWALEISSFLGPKWHSPICSLPFHRAQKTLNFQDPTPSHLPS